MDAFIDSVKSFSVWIGVVLGILASLAAAYLKPGIDRLGGTVSRRWGERTQVRAAARKREVDRLRANPHEQVMTAIEALDDKLKGIAYAASGFIVGSIGLLSLTEWLRWLGIVCFLVGQAGLLTSWKKLSLAKEARR
jgi:hypothetical protein